MVRITTARLAAAALALVGVAGLRSPLVQAAPQPKVTICHFDGEGVPHVISISRNALDAHLRNHEGDFEPPLLVFSDGDGDGFPGGEAEILCILPEGGSTESTDCNDADVNINPGTAEVAGNGVDDNCDGTIDEVVVPG